MEGGVGWWVGTVCILRMARTLLRIDKGFGESHVWHLILLTLQIMDFGFEPFLKTNGLLGGGVGCVLDSILLCFPFSSVQPLMLSSLCDYATSECASASAAKALCVQLIVEFYFDS